MIKFRGWAVTYRALMMNNRSSKNREKEKEIVEVLMAIPKLKRTDVFPLKGVKYLMISILIGIFK